MQIEAIYNKGKLEFLTPIKFLHKKFSLIVEIPDEDIITPSLKTASTDYQLPAEVITQAKAMEEELDRVRNAPLPKAEESSPLTPKKRERMKAFALRDEVKGLR